MLSIVGADQIGRKCWNTAEVLSILYLTSVSILLFCDKMLLDMLYWLLPVVISVLGGQLPINMTLVRNNNSQIIFKKKHAPSNGDNLHYLQILSWTAISWQFSETDKRTGQNKIVNLKENLSQISFFWEQFLCLNKSHWGLYHRNWKGSRNEVAIVERLPELRSEMQWHRFFFLLF